VVVVGVRPRWVGCALSAVVIGARRVHASPTLCLRHRHSVLARASACGRRARGDVALARPRRSACGRGCVQFTGGGRRRRAWMRPDRRRGGPCRGPPRMVMSRTNDRLSCRSCRGSVSFWGQHPIYLGHLTRSHRDIVWALWKGHFVFTITRGRGRVHTNVVTSRPFLLSIASHVGAEASCRRVRPRLAQPSRPLDVEAPAPTVASGPPARRLPCGGGGVEVTCRTGRPATRIATCSTSCSPSTLAARHIRVDHSGGHRYMDSDRRPPHPMSHMRCTSRTLATATA